MYVIIVYDIDVKRVAKVCKYLRQHLNWVQNSVFEGELTKAQLARVKSGLLGIIDDSEDSVLIYQMRHEKWMDRQVYRGRKKSGDKLIMTVYDRELGHFRVEGESSTPISEAIFFIHKTAFLPYYYGFKA